MLGRCGVLLLLVRVRLGRRGLLVAAVVVAALLLALALALPGGGAALGAAAQRVLARVEILDLGLFVADAAATPTRPR